MRVALFGLNWFLIQGKDNNKRGCLISQISPYSSLLQPLNQESIRAPKALAVGSGFMAWQSDG
jgi:hypothetical protein